MRKIIFWKLLMSIALTSMAASLATCPVRAQNEEPPETPEEAFSRSGGSDQVMLNLREADIHSLLQYYSELTGSVVIPGKGVKGTVTIICSVEIPISEAVSVIESVLEIKGFTIVRSGEKVVKVVPKKEAIVRDIETKSAEELAAIEPDDRLITQLIQMKYVDAAEMMGDLRPLISKSGNVFFNERTNILVITDTASNIKRLAGIIKELDVEVLTGKIQIRIIPLRYADEISLSQTLNEIFSAEVFAGTRKRERIPKKPPRRRGKGSSPPTPVSIKGLESLAGKVKIIPDSRLHSLVVICLTEDLPTVETLIETLDKEPPEAGDTTLVYYLQHAEATEMSAVLNGIYGGGTARAAAKGKKRTPVSPGGVSNLAGRVAIDSDERTNSLVITTSPANFEIIQRLIRKLDIEPPQVLIEAMIVEVTLDDKHYTGVDWNDLTFSLKEDKFIGSPETLWSLYEGGFRYSLVETDTQAEAILQILQQTGTVEILSEPRISASNNEEAMILVGDKIPVLKRFQQQAEAGASLIQDFEYTDVGIKLTITPRINQERVVTLKIGQEINEYIGDVPVGTGTAPQFSTRQAETVRVVRDCETVVLGGLIKDKRSTAVTKIPLLGDIPLLGFFFRRTSELIEKKELLVFITPRVMLTVDEAEAVSRIEEMRTAKASRLKRLKQMEGVFQESSISEAKKQDRED